MTITQNYFHDKYEFFNKKYHISEEDFKKLKIDPLERLNYAMGHCFPDVFLTFIICEIVQFIVNYIFFSTRRHMNNIAIEKNINDSDSQIIIYDTPGILIPDSMYFNELLNTVLELPKAEQNILLRQVANN